MTITRSVYHADQRKTESGWQLLDQPQFQLVGSMAILGIATGLASFSKPWLGEGFSSLILVVGLVLIGAFAGLTAAVVSALVGSAVFNLVVIEPVWEFQFQKLSDFAAPAVFVMCAVVSGGLSGRMRDQSRRAQQANRRIESLLQVSRDLQAVRDIGAMQQVLLAQLAQQPEIGVALFWQIEGMMQQVASNTLPDGAALHHEPLSDGRIAVGTLAYAPAIASGEDASFITGLAQLCSLALTRLQLDTEVAETRILARSEVLKTALLSSVSHDFRSPLTSIGTAASSLLTFGEAMDATTRNDLLGNIVDECERLNHLTENLLQMTRLQAGQAQFSNTVLGTIDMVQRCIARLRPQAGSRQFVIDAPPSDVLILGDAALFELALINVLQNAIKYSGDATAISVRIAPHPTACAIAITDEGSGIPAEEHERVFERFYRGERRQSGPQGSGLGLAIAKGFVEAAGGTIGLTSPVRNGKGTTVTITLPLAPEQIHA